MIHLEADGLPDDRIVCIDCAQAHKRGRNLHCTPFKCDTLPELKRRCVKFIPRRGLDDQRTGAQRWPAIVAEIEEVARMDAARNPRA